MAVAELVEPLLKTSHDRLWAMDQEASLLTFHMSIEATVTGPEPPQPEQRLQMAEVEDAFDDDDGVQPNQQAVAQELLGRLILATG